MRIAQLSLVVIIVLAAGCGTLSIGRAPTDLDLQNDGTTAAQSALQKRYALAFREGYLERPGVTPAMVQGEINAEVAEVRSGAWSDEAAEYLASSELAFDATDTALVGFDRFAHSGTPVLILQAGGVLVGTAVGATLALVSAPANQDAVDSLANVSNAAFSGAFTGLLISLPLVIVYDWSVPTLSSALSASDYRKGVRAFNKDLERRILRQAPKPQPAPPPPTPPPSSDEPPPPVPLEPTTE